MKLHHLVIFFILFKFSIGFQLKDIDAFFNYNKGLTYRLPRTIIPKKYLISIKPNLKDPRDKNFLGRVQILCSTNQQDVKSVTLHSRNISYNSIQILAVDKPGYNNPIIVKQTVDAEKDFLTLTLSRSLIVNQTYVIKVDYKGLLNEDLQGLYVSTYQNVKKETVRIAATRYQATLARTTFPCFDEPTFKSSFQLNITRSVEYNSTLSNTEKVTVIESPGYITDVFRETPLIPTYLLGFVITNFQALRNVQEKIAIYTRSEIIKQAEYAYSLCLPILNFYKTYTNVQFPYKLDLVALPDFSKSAVNTWGLSTFKESALLYDQKECSSRHKQYVANIVAHQLSHAWIGSLITVEWWNYAWIIEGFARFFQYKAISSLQAVWEMEKQFIIEQQHTAYESDSLKTSTELSRPVSTPIEISNVFNPFASSKGACLIQMLEHCLGEKTFKAGINTYMNKYLYNNSKPEYLYESLQQEAVKSKIQINITDLMSTWTEKSGFPCVTVDLTGKKDEVSISQSQFLFGEKEEKKTYWDIPLTYTFEGNKNPVSTKPVYWLKKTGESLNITISGLQNKWILFNPEGAGYYRVNYGKKLWYRLISYLRKSVNIKQSMEISKIGRAQIIDNALNLARAGIIDYKITFKVLDYLRYEVDYYPWVTAFRGFSYIIKRLESDSVALVQFKKYVITLMGKLYIKYGFKESSSETQVESLNRANCLEWACKLGVYDCIQKSTRLFDNFMSFNKSISANIRYAVYSTALRNKGTARWNYLWNKYLTTNIPSEQETILFALGCSKNEEILTNYLEKTITIDSGLRKQDVSSVFTSVYSGGSLGVKVSLDFLVENHAQIIKSYGGITGLADCISGISKYLTTSQQIEKLETFLVSIRSDYPELKYTSTVALQVAKTNFKWYGSYKNVVVTILKKIRLVYPRKYGAGHGSRIRNIFN